MLKGNTQQITVSKERLIEYIKKNYIIHKREYDEAVFEYRAKVLHELDKKINEFENGGIDCSKNFIINIMAPVNHSDDYEDIIDMLELSVDEFITLDRESYKKYVKNEWDWMNSFKLTKLSYTI